jgi:hypothetical protein
MPIISISSKIKISFYTYSILMDKQYETSINSALSCTFSLLFFQISDCSRNASKIENMFTLWTSRDPSLFRLKSLFLIFFWTFHLFVFYQEKYCRIRSCSKCNFLDLFINQRNLGRVNFLIALRHFLPNFLIRFSLLGLPHLTFLVSNSIGFKFLSLIIKLVAKMI